MKTQLTCHSSSVYVLALLVSLFGFSSCVNQQLRASWMPPASTFGPFSTHPFPLTAKIQTTTRLNSTTTSLTTLISTFNINFVQGWFSAPVLNTTALSSPNGVEIVMPLPGVDATLCTSIPSSPYYTGKVLLVMYTGCPMQYASLSGIAGLIAYGCSPLAPSNCDPTTLFAFYLGGEVATGGNTAVTFPVLYINSGDGVALTSLIKTNGPSLMTSLIVKGTGPIEPADKQALIKIANAITFVTTPVYYPPSISWKDPMLSDPNYDPCISSTPLMAIWCENGRVVGLIPCFNQISGPFFDNLYLLPQLTNLIMPGNPTTGTIPESFCTLTKLVAFDAIDNSLSGLPSCIGSMSSLAYLRLNGNKLTSLPPSITNIAPNLAQLWLQGNQIGSFPDLSLFTSLNDIDISGNNGNGTMASFNGAPLWNLNLASNRISGTMGANFLDNLPALTKLDISSNLISGVLPNFVNSTSLLTINIANNMLSGPMPLSWSSLQQLTTLSASNNRITSLLPLAGCTLLQSADLSFNRVSNGGLDIATMLRNLAIGNRINTLVLDSNMLTGPFTNNSYMYPVTWLTHLSMSHNSITTLPVHLFDTNFFPAFAYFDMSYNALSGAFPPGSPSSSLTFFSLVGNSGLSVASLPAWLATDASTLTTGTGLSYACPSVVAALTKTMIVHTDPAFHNFEGCVCSNGYYGFAPNCTLIPPQVSLIGPGNFTDSIFNDNRFLSGMDTTWTLTAPASSSSVRVITLSLWLTPSFNSSLNVITISLGGDGASALLLSSNNANTAASSANLIVTEIVSGTQSAVQYQQVIVLDNGATVNFKSRDTNSVAHFTVSAQYSYQCPNGYALSVERSRCQLVFVPDVTYSYAVFAVASIVVAVLLCMLAVIVVYRESNVIRAASTPFCIIMLLFLIILAVGSIFYAIEPSTSSSPSFSRLSSASGAYICHARPWFTGVGVVGLMATLLVKTIRIKMIFNKKILTDAILTDQRIGLTVCFLLLIELLLLICFSSLPFSRATSSIGSGVSANTIVNHCVAPQDDNGDLTWIVLQFTYVALFLIWSVSIAFGIRKVPSAFNESSHIINCLTVLLSLGTIIVITQFVVDADPNALIIIRGLGQSIVALLLALAIFGPKLYVIIDGRAHEKVEFGKNSVFQTGSRNTKTHRSGDTDSVSRQLSELRVHNPSLYAEAVAGLRKYFAVLPPTASSNGSSSPSSASIGAAPASPSNQERDRDRDARLRAPSTTVGASAGAGGRSRVSLAVRGSFVNGQPNGNGTNDTLAPEEVTLHIAKQSVVER